MRPLAWTELTALVLISALLVGQASAQTTTTAPAASNDSLDLSVPQTQPPPAPPLPPGMLVTGLTWLERPNAQDFSRLYPTEAMEAQLNARVVLDCIVAEDGRLNCTVASEDPPGYGFAESTLRISRFFRMAPQTRDGVPTAGGRVRLPVRWMVS